MKKIIHFGAGSLGKGFIIPILVESGYEVIVVDANKNLVNKLKDTKEYTMHIIDESKDKQDHQIKISDAYNLKEDQQEIIELLKGINVITTSVRQENLIHVAELVSKVWKDEKNEERSIICCENIEDASTYFKNLLYNLAEKEEDKVFYSKLRVPNTMVDRACSPDISDPLRVNSEKFYEICVDKKELPDTGIKLIPSEEDTKKHFFRKRFLLNTYVDAFAFMGLCYGLQSFQETIRNKSIIEELQPYFTLVNASLIKVLGISEEEVSRWQELYKNRFLKSDENGEGFERPLNEIARDMLRKLGLEERFVKPLVLLKSINEDISNGFPLIAKIAEYEAKRNGMTYDGVCKTLENMWCCNDAGNYIYNEVSKRINL